MGAFLAFKQPLSPLVDRRHEDRAKIGFPFTECFYHTEVLLNLGRLSMVFPWKLLLTAFRYAMPTHALHFMSCPEEIPIILVQTDKYLLQIWATHQRLLHLKRLESGRSVKLFQITSFQTYLQWWFLSPLLKLLVCIFSNFLITLRRENHCPRHRSGFYLLFWLDIKNAGIFSVVCLSCISFISKTLIWPLVDALAD